MPWSTYLATERSNTGGLEKRTSAAEAVKRQTIYGTAEAVPFVKSLFPIWLRPSPTLKAVPFV